MFEPSTEETKVELKDFPIKFQKLKQNINHNIFNMIEESDSDEDGNLGYEFERARKKELSK